MSSTDLNIFTNADSVKMIDRMKTVLSHADFFDCLVGYFRITGFYLLKQELEKVKEIRLLVGLGVDPITKEAVQLTLFDQNAFKIQPILRKQIKEEFETSEDSLEVENGINTFIEWIKNGKIKIRICADKNVHAKVYIVRNDETVKDLQYGNVITGSSNFSYNGLQNNIEFNVELKSRNEVDYSLIFFNSLWNNAIEITNLVNDIVKNETWMNVTISPYKLFLKTLYSYFEDEIGDNNVDIERPDDFLRLEYQDHAVIQAKRILEKHGGVIIADVVGLGKTYIAAMLGKYLGAKKRCLFIVPPVVQEYWQSVIADFNYSQRDKVVSLGIVDQVAQWDDLGKYDYVFVDEAHRFRNADSKEFQHLKEICYGKGVILITATPQNNYITDIVNLISLFQDLKESSIIPGNPDLQGFFASIKRNIVHAKGTADFELVVNNSITEIRNKVLKNVMVRRTRTEVIKYYKDDLDKQGISFPTLHDPEKLTYIYNDAMDKAFNDTIVLLSKLKYARYTPLLYVKTEYQREIVGDKKSGQENIKGFIKGMLVKRLESSIYAFKESINRINKSLNDFYKLYLDDKIVIGASSRNNNYDFEYLASLDDNEFEELISQRDLMKIPRNVLEDRYNVDLLNDLTIFKQLCDIWSQFDVQRDDAKFDILAELLKELKKDKTTKVIIFSEAKDTVVYLESKLNNVFLNEVVSFCGSDSESKKKYIKQNFDPKDKNPLEEKKILVTTDSMSEGINLHRASIIINYDLPWNPTRVMQRVGRINRVGSKYSDLFVYNFFPAANTREHLSLEDSIKVKIQMFHTLLGEDFRYLTDEEIVEPQEFFDILMMKNFKLTDEGEEFNLNATKMEYLKIINDVKKNDPILFDEISSLPNKLRLARFSNKTELVTFVRKGSFKEFIYTDGIKTEELEFDKAMELIQCEESESKIDLPANYYDFLNLNTHAFKEKVNKSFGNGMRAKGSPKNEKEVNKYIKWLEKQELKYEDKDLLNQISEMIEKGVLTNYVYKEILKAINALKNKNDIKAIIKCFSEKIPSVYFKERKQYEVEDVFSAKEVVILSEYFIKGEN